MFVSSGHYTHFFNLHNPENTRDTLPRTSRSTYASRHYIQ